MHRQLTRCVLAMLAAALLAAAARTALAAPALAALQANPGKTSVSGLSSGGFMAVQYGVAFSASVKGVGVIAGGPYNCANLEFGIARACISGHPSGASSWSAAQGFSALGQIDPAQGIARQRVYVFGGTQDNVVSPQVVAATRDFYRAAGVPADDLAFVDQVPAGHAFVVPAFGNTCGRNAAPFIERCELGGEAYDQPLQILRHIYGPLKPAASTLSTSPQPFDQREFARAATSLDPTGFVYIPAACASDSRDCAVHVVFHGCRQGHESVGDDVYAHAGFNRWADSNRIIVLYPQVMKSRLLPFNPRGCWDWWGFFYTGPAFMVRDGAQLSAVKRMVDRLTGVQPR